VVESPRGFPSTTAAASKRLRLKPPADGLPDSSWVSHGAVGPAGLLADRWHSCLRRTGPRRCRGRRRCSDQVAAPAVPSLSRTVLD
jgi:hypothetical protein